MLGPFVVPGARMRKPVTAALLLAASFFGAACSAAAQPKPQSSDACVAEIQAVLVRMRDAGPQRHVEEMTTTGRSERRTSIFAMPQSLSVEITRTSGEGPSARSTKSKVIVITPRVWRIVDGAWSEVEASEAAKVVEGVRAAHARMADVDASEALCDGTDTVEGAPVKVYTFSQLFAVVGASGITITKIYVGADGRPMRIDSSSKMADQVIIRRNAITYDPSLRIEPPLR
jgi:hypothetical protein